MKLRLHYKPLLMAGLLLAGSVVWAGESATAVKADALRAEPYADAKTVATLSAGSTVEILKREGGWYQVKSAQGSGWIRMLSLRKGDAQKPAAASASSLAGLASGRAGTGKVVSTTGIRGLNEEELKAAKFDEKQVSLAESYQVSRAEAQKYAAKAKLKPAKIDYLP